MGRQEKEKNAGKNSSSVRNDTKVGTRAEGRSYSKNQDNSVQKVTTLHVKKIRRENSQAREKKNESRKRMLVTQKKRWG